MAIHFIYGASSSGKSRHLYQYLLNEAKANPKHRFFVVVPEQFSLQTQKELVLLNEQGHGIWNIDVQSFMRLAWRIFAETGCKERVILEDTGKSMVLQKLLSECEEQLCYFGRNIKKPGFVDEIKSLLSEFYQYGIGEEELVAMKDIAGKNPRLHKKVTDMELLYHRFEEFLSDRYITTEGICDLLRDQVAKSELLQGSTICFDGFSGFTPSQYKLIGEMMRYVKEMYFTVTMDAGYVGKVQKEHQLFYLSYSTVQEIEKLAAKNKVDVVTDKILTESARFGAKESLKVLGSRLFRYPSVPYEKEVSDITIHSYRDEREEIRFTVQEIKRLVREGGYRYRDIAVVTADMEGYAKRMEKEFKDALIPAFIDQKKPILNHAFIQFILACLDLVATDFSYDAVFRFLKSPLAKITGEECDEFENYILAVGIRHFSSYKKEWEYRYRTRKELNLERINQVRIRLVEAVEPLYRVMKQKDSTVREKMTALYQFLAAHNAEEFLNELAAVWKTEKPLEAKEAEQLFRIVLDIFDRIVALMGEDVVELKEFIQILKTGFSEAKIGLVPPGMDQVVVGDIERSRLKDVKVLFFLGVNEGLVPKTGNYGGILSESDRNLLSRAGIRLAPGRKESAFQAEFYLYLTLTKPSDRLYLSYHRSDGSGAPGQPSYLIERIHSLFPKLTEKTEDHTDLYTCLGNEAGYGYLICNVQRFIRGEIGQDDYFEALYRLYAGEEENGFTAFLRLTKENLADAVYYRRNETPLSEKNARALYREQLAGSVSRMESFAKCAFAHFLNYGMELEERKEYSIAMPDIGNVYHEALRIYSETIKSLGYSWHTISQDVSDKIQKEAALKAAGEYNNGIFNGSKRNEFLLARIDRMLKRTVNTVKEQIRSGEFEPFAFEQAFSYSDRYLALRGRIDRIDLCEKDGNWFVRVIDYKSGNNMFRMDRLYYGLQIQLAVYLKAAMDFVKQETGKAVIPAGMLYYHIDDPIVEKADGADNYEEMIFKKLSMHGLSNRMTEVICAMDKHFTAAAGGLLPQVKSSVIPVETTKDGSLASRSIVASSERMMMMLEATKEKLHEESKQIYDGFIEPRPYREGQETACEFCSYKSACFFDASVPGYEYRDLNKMDAEEVWNEIMKGNEDGAGNQTEKTKMDTGSAEGH